MKLDIILAGVGGQGIISIASVIGSAALKNNLFLKQSEVHGMSQRGGDVQSHLRISNQLIYSDLIPQGAADLILSIEPMESLRYLPYLSQTGWLVTNTEPYKNIQNYPEMEAILKEIESQPRHLSLNADEMAKSINALKSMNIVMLGAASLYIPISYESLEDGIRDIFGKKGSDIVNMNLQAMKLGRDFAEKSKK